MSLRPRYSLLTLLVLMALVAGGLKLWYGPHQIRTEFEEGTFTRDWQGNHNYHGSHITRGINFNNVPGCTEIVFYRQGIYVRWSRFILIPGKRDTSNTIEFSFLLQWTEQEALEHKQAIEQELRRFTEQNITVNIYNAFG